MRSIKTVDVTSYAHLRPLEPIRPKNVTYRTWSSEGKGAGKLAKADVSSSKVSKIVYSLVISKRSCARLARFKSLIWPPAAVTVVCAATNSPSPEVSIYLTSAMFRRIFLEPPSASPTIFVRSALQPSPNVSLPLISMIATPRFSRVIIFTLMKMVPFRRDNVPGPGLARWTPGNPGRLAVDSYEPVGPDGV